uniref:Tetratricopeptide repeat protein n=1 Tax=Yoonia rhodophyticola TaxID=3137370 RepID=A0AAN0MBQ9_9RHOB
MADPNSGSYLAARHASNANDFAASARFFTKSLIADPTDPYLLENAMTAFIALGQVDRAIPVAQVMVDNGYQSQIAHLTLSLQAAKTGQWDQIFAALEQGRSVAPLVDGIAQAWAHLGEGDMTKALASFDQVIETPNMTVYGMTHKAYALASVGDFEGAEAIFNGAATGNVLRYSTRSATARAQILSQLGRNEDALAIIDGVFGKQLDPRVAELRAELAAGTAVAFDAVRTPQKAWPRCFRS